MMTTNFVMQRAAVFQRNADERLLGFLGRLADGFRHFARLAMTEADAALLVADDDECGETEAAAALHNLRNAIDVNQLVDEFVVALFAVIAISTTATLATTAFFTCHAQNSKPPSRAASASALMRPW